MSPIDPMRGARVPLVPRRLTVQEDPLLAPRSTVSTVYFASPVALLLSHLAHGSAKGCAIAHRPAADDDAPQSEQSAGPSSEALAPDPR